MKTSNFLLKPLLALAIALPVMSTVSVGEADASHKKFKRGAIIAGAVIGGAIAYRHYKKRKKYRHHSRKYYGASHRSHHHRKRSGYYHTHGRYDQPHYHPY